PAGVPGLIVMTPVVGSMAICPGSGLVPGVKVMSAGSRMVPFNRSLFNPDVVVPPTMLLTDGYRSSMASIVDSPTLTVTLAEEQLAGFKISQIVYGMV